MKRAESEKKSKDELTRQSNVVGVAGISTLFVSMLGVLSFFSSRSLLVFTSSIFSFAYGARCINDFLYIRKHVRTHRLLLKRKQIEQREKEARIVEILILFAMSMLALIYALKYYSKHIPFNSDIMFGFGMGSVILHITCYFMMRGELFPTAVTREYSSKCLQCVGVDLCVISGSMLLAIYPMTTLDFTPALVLIGTVLTKNFRELLRL